MLKVTPQPWTSGSKQIWIRSLKWSTLHSWRSRGYKNIKDQSWRSIKNLPVRPAPSASGSRPAKLTIFFATSNFDLKYFCSLLTYKNVQYLIWKIWFISVWSLKPKAVVWLLTGFMLGQSTLISYHREANGYIFFAVGVGTCEDMLITFYNHLLVNYLPHLLSSYQGWQKNLRVLEVKHLDLRMKGTTLFLCTI